jgi:RNA polymerase sigma-70 factor, ECF subfamily
MGVQICDPEELARMAREGDIDVLDRITRCYGERLMAVGVRRCRDEADAEDAVQDALLNAAEHLEAFRAEGRIDAWLSRMVANACSRMRRGRKNDPGLHDFDAEIASESDPERDAMRAHLAEQLQAALMELSPSDRAVLLLAEVEGWTGPEIAEHLQTSAGAVRVRLTRLRARMRVELGPKDAVDG